MNDENITPVPEVEPEFKSTLTPEQLATALSAVQGRSFSARHPELGKMKNCQVCGERHRVNERKCEQKFTNRVGDYEFFREDEKGELVPDYRTAIPADAKPTMKQIVGAAQFSKKRIHPHPSKIKLLLIERVRIIFQNMGFNLENEDKEQFKKDLHTARVLAARELRKERRLKTWHTNTRQHESRRINRGLL